MFQLSFAICRPPSRKKKYVAVGSSVFAVVQSIRELVANTVRACSPVIGIERFLKTADFI